jgi:hypothetical protein
MNQKFLREEADLKRILRDKTTDKDKKLDAIYDLIDELMLSGNFDQIDKILSESKINDPDIMLAYLTVTLPAKDKLKSREDYRLRASIILGEELLIGL